MVSLSFPLRYYRHECGIYGMGMVVVLSMWPLLYHQKDSSALKGTVESEVYRISVYASLIVAIPMSVNVLIDICSSRELIRHMFCRVFICGLLLFNSLMHIYFDNYNNYAAVVIKDMSNVLIGSVAVHQYMLRGRGAIPVQYYYGILACSVLGIAMRCYDVMVPALFSVGEAMKGTANVCMWGITLKHLYLYSQDYSVKDSYTKCQDTSFVAFLIFTQVSGIIYAIFSVEDLTFDERSGETLVGVSYAIVVLSTLISIVITHEYRHQYALLQQKLGVKRMFMRHVSHEIRTPLNAAMLGLQLMDERLEEHLSSKQLTAHGGVTEMVTGILSLSYEVRLNADVAVSVLNDLLQYDKIEVGSMHMEVDLVDIWRVGTESVQMFSAQAAQAGVSLHVLEPSTDPHLSLDRKAFVNSLHVRGDSIRLAQAFRNLISNALKFSGEGSTVEVVSEWRKDGLSGEEVSSLTNAWPKPVTSSPPPTPDSPCRQGSVVFSVIDHGPGMSAEEVERLFSEGTQFRANKLQAGGGSGLGLFISKGIVELHDGLIAASSAGHGCGSTFSIELPLFGEKTSSPPRVCPLCPPVYSPPLLLLLKCGQVAAKVMMLLTQV